MEIYLAFMSSLSNFKATTGRYLDLKYAGRAKKVLKNNFKDKGMGLRPISWNFFVPESMGKCRNPFIPSVWVSRRAANSRAFPFYGTNCEKQAT